MFNSPELNGTRAKLRSILVIILFSPVNNASMHFFPKPHIPIIAMHVCFAQSWLSLDINTLVTTTLSVLIVQGTKLCHTNLNKITVSHIFSRFLAFSDCF